MDKSVSKLWKDFAKRRGCWLGAIVKLTARSSLRWMATREGGGVKQKTLIFAGKALWIAVLSPFELPPENVGRAVDKVGVMSCSPRF